MATRRMLRIGRRHDRRGINFALATPMSAIGAIILEGDRGCRLGGLSLTERALRVARRAGATTTLVISTSDDRQRVRAWAETAGLTRLFIIDADQLVHTPLVEGLTGTALAVVPAAPAASDLAPGQYAGALSVEGEALPAVIAAVTRGDSDEDIARALPLARRVPHGSVARHPVRTVDERAAAERLLFTILMKPQDNAITRVLYRPVSSGLTRLLVHTPITPNQVSYLTAILVGLGLWLTAHAAMSWVVAGTAVVLIASYIDCCDGEIARIKLKSSRFGAWLDTVVDELSTVGYLIALGWHCHLYYGDDYLGQLGASPWKVAIIVGTVTYAVSIYCIYYNIIVMVGSANSQDYVGRFEVVPGDVAGTVQLRPAARQPVVVDPSAPPWRRWVATYVPYVVRRDFLSWAALAFALAHLTHILFGFLVLGGLGTALIVSRDHIQLRRQRRLLPDRG
jgi:phosphatidylglycerophosphate synthase